MAEPTESLAVHRPIQFGEPLPLVYAASNRNPHFSLGSLGGRLVLICAIGDVESDAAKRALAAIPREPRHEGQRAIAIFLAGETSADLEPITENRIILNDANAARASRLIDPREPEGRWVLLDPALRVLATWRLQDTESALRVFESAPSPDQLTGGGTAPVLLTANVFEPALCARLIDYYRTVGANPTGVARQDSDGRTFVALDSEVKRRSDCVIQDEALRDALMQRIYYRLAPMIERAFMWRPTRMERYLIARYAADEGGFFKPHRDNTTNGTAHRRFAVTINLNADEYEGGDLRFPEFGARTYRAPTGGAVVFSCAMLHEATPITKGERYAFLPFLYDDAAAKLRESNVKYLDESLKGYRNEG